MNLFLFIKPADVSDRRDYSIRKRHAKGKTSLRAGAWGQENHWEQRRK
jgi:hypothetical protein